MTPTQPQIVASTAALKVFLDTVVLPAEVPALFEGMAEADVDKYLLRIVMVVLNAAAAVPI